MLRNFCTQVILTLLSDVRFSCSNMKLLLADLPFVVHVHTMRESVPLVWLDWNLSVNRQKWHMTVFQIQCIFVPFCNTAHGLVNAYAKVALIVHVFLVCFVDTFCVSLFCIPWLEMWPNDAYILEDYLSSALFLHNPRFWCNSSFTDLGSFTNINHTLDTNPRPNKTLLMGSGAILHKACQMVFYSYRWLLLVLLANSGLLCKPPEVGWKIAAEPLKSNREVNLRTYVFRENVRDCEIGV